MILGNLGADPEVRYTQSQLAICSLRIATNDRRKNSDGEWIDETEWHKVTVFGKQAENCAQYLKKGRQAFIEGKIKTSKWQDKEGNDRYTTEIIANNVQFVGSKSGGASYEAPKGAPAAAAASSSKPVTSGGVESVPFDDDDIPF